MINKLRYWLIRKLAGYRVIGINLILMEDGCIFIPGPGFYFADCCFNFDEDALERYLDEHPELYGPDGNEDSDDD